MTNEVDVPRKSAYEMYAEQAVGGPSFVGDLLKFDKFGDWKAGQEERDVPEGTRLIVGIRTLQIGWIKWEDGKPVVVNMVLLDDIDNGTASPPPKRDTLGDDDKSLWEQDDKGVPVDPWVFTNSVVLYDPEDGQLYTFSTRSKGGINALGRVVKAFNAHVKAYPDEVPTVTLGSDSYPHAKYGKIMIPMLNILQDEWVEMPDEIVNAAPHDAGEEAAPAKPAPKQIAAPRGQGKPAAKPNPRNTPTPAKPSKPTHRPAQKSGGRGTGGAKTTVMPGQKRNGPQKGVRF